MFSIKILLYISIIMEKAAKVLINEAQEKKREEIRIDAKKMDEYRENQIKSLVVAQGMDCLPHRQF